ncbi:MAG: hypothetical protein PHR35_05950 [Kiritimatiellae bacterium]|nr:hypothetical protein [Kiritimatiellia bacterium]
MSIYKRDMSEAQQRLSAWWAGNKVDRTLAAVTAPIDPSHPRVTTFAADIPSRYTDASTIASNLDYVLERAFMGGEAFPLDGVYLGPMFHLAFFGCEPHFAETTTWYDPCFETVDDALAGLRFDPENRWWLHVKDWIRWSLEHSKGRYLTSLGPMPVAMMDTLAGLLGTEKLMFALAEEPEKLHALRDHLSTLSRQIRGEIYALFRDSSQHGTIDGMCIWSPGKVLTSQCDLSVMISPTMFREFVVPELEASYADVDHAIYHLDGEEEIQHLDALLAIERLRLIQWIPSTRMAAPEYRKPLNWIPLFRRIQEAGKAVLIYCPPQDVSALLSKIDRSRAILFVNCEDVRTAEQTLLDLDRIGV